MCSESPSPQTQTPHFLGCFCHSSYSPSCPNSHSVPRCFPNATHSLRWFLVRLPNGALPASAPTEAPHAGRLRYLRISPAQELPERIYLLPTRQVEGDEMAGTRLRRLPVAVRGRGTRFMSAGTTAAPWSAARLCCVTGSVMI